ncbi:hypothetical protein CEXT_173551 [Caerostris extrusa]|uniref:Uncharacterized protein n=1 Tax=Caerostris extrusa TaxID=172846 RepID=A0AAV4RY71_CAEEX|nr:hypothetical protein CEXT_173551 [Caerostris extrusa]
MEDHGNRSFLIELERAGHGRGITSDTAWEKKKKLLIQEYLKIKGWTESGSGRTEEVGASTVKNLLIWRLMKITRT